MLFDSVLVEGILKHFVVINKFVVMLGRPFDLLEVEGLGIDRVHNLAVNSGSCALLDLGDVQLKELIHPLDNNSLAYEVGLIHNTD